MAGHPVSDPVVHDDWDGDRPVGLSSQGILADWIKRATYCVK